MDTVRGTERTFLPLTGVIKPVGHIAKPCPRLRFHKPPLLRARVLDLDPPRVRAEDGHGSAVRVRVVRCVLGERFGGRVDEVQGGIGGLGRVVRGFIVRQR